MSSLEPVNEPATAGQPAGGPPSTGGAIGGTRRDRGDGGSLTSRRPLWLHLPQHSTVFKLSNEAAAMNAYKRDQGLPPGMQQQPVVPGPANPVGPPGPPVAAPPVAIPPADAP